MRWLGLFLAVSCAGAPIAGTTDVENLEEVNATTTGTTTPAITNPIVVNATGDSSDVVVAAVKPSEDDAPAEAASGESTEQTETTSTTTGEPVKPVRMTCNPRLAMAKKEKCEVLLKMTPSDGELNKVCGNACRYVQCEKQAYLQSGCLVDETTKPLYTLTAQRTAEQFRYLGCIIDDTTDTCSEPFGNLDSLKLCKSATSCGLEESQKVKSFARRCATQVSQCDAQNRFVGSVEALTEQQRQLQKTALCQCYTDGMDCILAAYDVNDCMDAGYEKKADYSTSIIKYWGRQHALGCPSSNVPTLVSGAECIRRDATEFEIQTKIVQDSPDDEFQQKLITNMNEILMHLLQIPVESKITLIREAFLPGGTTVSERRLQYADVEVTSKIYCVNSCIDKKAKIHGLTSEELTAQLNGVSNDLASLKVVAIAEGDTTVRVHEPETFLGISTDATLWVVFWVMIGVLVVGSILTMVIHWIMKHKNDRPMTYRPYAQEDSSDAGCCDMGEGDKSDEVYQGYLMPEYDAYENDYEE